MTTASRPARILGIVSGVLIVPLLAFSVRWDVVYQWGRDPMWIALNFLSLLFVAVVMVLALVVAFLRHKRGQVVVLWIGFSAGAMRIVWTVLMSFVSHQWQLSKYAGGTIPPFNIGTALTDALGFYVYQPEAGMPEDVFARLWPIASVGFDLATAGLLVAALIARASKGLPSPSPATMTSTVPATTLYAGTPQAGGPSAHAAPAWAGATHPMTRPVQSTAPRPPGAMPVAAPPAALVITPEVRRGFLVEAIRRDPSFATAQDPETLRRLGETMGVIEQEYRLKFELAQLQDAHIAAVDRAATGALGPPSDPARDSRTSWPGQNATGTGLGS